MGYVKVEHPDDKYRLYSQLKKLRLPYVVCFESVFRKRTLNQNKYYQKFILTVFAKETGRTRKEAEEELLIEHALIQEYKDEEGNVIYEVERTSDMSTMRKEEFLEDCRAYAYAKYGIYLLAPNEAISEALDLHGKTKKIKKK